MQRVKGPPRSKLLRFCDAFPARFLCTRCNLLACNLGHRAAPPTPILALLCWEVEEEAETVATGPEVGVEEDTGAPVEMVLQKCMKRLACV